MSGLAHIHIEAIGGMAGDMFVAAMLDAFPQLAARVFADLEKVLPKEAGRPELSEGRSGAIRVRRFGLLPSASSRCSGRNSHHRHGSFRDLMARINGASLSEGTAAQASAILTHLARAESRIHQVPLEEVHFHEIADWDSLMDVVAAGSIIAALSEATWSVSDLPRGGGVVHTEHGQLPVPAPATVEILKGFIWRDDGISGERVTPTGAAILRTVVSVPARKADGELVGSGYGAGARDLPDMPNVVRALAFAKASTAPPSDRVAVLSFEVDDMTGEEIGVAAEKLRAVEGVLDLTIGMLAGKKGRPVSAFRLLVVPDSLEAAKECCLTETSTIGVRWRIEERRVLARESIVAEQDATCVRVKRVSRPGGEVTSKAESDDLVHLGGLARRRSVKKQTEEGSGR
jgi:uncharacterized protein (TIGR00299 family) protein